MLLPAGIGPGADDSPVIASGFLLITRELRWLEIMFWFFVTNAESFFTIDRHGAHILRLPH